MPDGQSIAWTDLFSLEAKVPLGLAQKEAALLATAHEMANESLTAQNRLLRSALERQRSKAADLRSILCSMDLATLCVCPTLKLRLFTVAAGRLLGIGPNDVGLTLSLCLTFGFDRTLMSGIKAVLESGVPEEQVVALASGQMVLCRLLPLHAFGSAEPAVDGVIITFAATNPASATVPATCLPDCRPAASTGPDDGGLAAGYPDLAYGLTRRQHQVLGHVLAGHPSKNIAADLGISQRTVENHRAAIMARTGATSLPALARLAIGADVGGDCKPATSRHVCN
jgi:DNA-binding CsgD family transcriptional regulator